MEKRLVMKTDNKSLRQLYLDYGDTGSIPKWNLWLVIFIGILVFGIMLEHYTWDGSLFEYFVYGFIDLIISAPVFYFGSRRFSAGWDLRNNGFNTKDSIRATYYLHEGLSTSVANSDVLFSNASSQNLLIKKINLMRYRSFVLIKKNVGVIFNYIPNDLQSSKVLDESILYDINNNIAQTLGFLSSGQLKDLQIAEDMPFYHKMRHFKVMIIRRQNNNY